MLVVKTTSPATSPSPVKLQPSKWAPSSRTTFALSPYSKPRSCRIVHQRATNYSTYNPTRQTPPEVSRIRRTAKEGVPLHDPLLRKIYQRQVCRRAHPYVPRTPNPVSRGAAHGLHQARERELAAQDQFGVEGGERRLVPEETGRGLLERELLLLGGVRRVVGSHEVEDSLLQGLG